MENLSPSVVSLKATEKGKLIAEDSKNELAIYDILKNGLELGKVGEYEFKERNGKIYRIGKNGVEFPPIPKEKYEKIRKIREEVFSSKNVKTSERKLKNKIQEENTKD